MKQAARILGAVCRGLLIALAAVMLVLTILNLTAVGPKAPGLFGFKAYAVLSDSMSPVFEAGDLIFTRPVDPQQVQKGDIIAFLSSNPASYNEVVTHRVHGITQYRDERAYLTAGDNAASPDAVPAQASHILGQYCASVPKLGFLFSFLKTPGGYLLLIFIPLFLLMLYETIHMLRGMTRYRRNMRRALEHEYDRLKAGEVQLREEGEQLAERREALQKEETALKELSSELTRLRAELEDRLREETKHPR